MNSFDRYTEKYGDKLIWLLIGGYVFIFGYICFLKYCSFGYFDWDFASDIIVLWNSVQGRIFYYPFLEQIIFGAHLYLIILLLIPIYAVFQHPLTLLFLQSLFLGLAAYPLYLLAKLKLNKSFALLISLAYLLYPSVGHINLFETHFEIYEIFFLFFALYFFEKANFGKFLIFIFLAITCKENVSLVVFMFGIYALLRKRTKRWILVPSLLGIVWFFLAVKVIIPYFAKDVRLYQEGFIFSSYYRHLGNSIFDMVKTIIMHPIAVAKYAFTQRKILYLIHLFLPTGFLVFLSPAVLLITIPIFMQNLLSAAPTHAVITYQYVALLIPFIFFSLVHAFKKLLDDKTIYNYRVLLLSGFLSVSIISCIFLGGPQLHLVKHIRANRIDDLAKEKDKLVKMIPKDAPVIATFQFLPKLANRYDLYSMHFVSTGFKMYTKVKYEPPANLEYALIDFNEPLLINSFFTERSPDNISNFLEKENFKLVKAIGDTALFKKNYDNPNKLFEISSSFKRKNKSKIRIGGQLEFLGFDIEHNDIKLGDTLHLTHYWRRIGDIDSDLVLFIQFLNQSGQIVLEKFHILGYRIYPPADWKRGNMIKEDSWFLIPSQLREGRYSLRCGVFSLKNNSILPISEDLQYDNVDNLDRIILSNIVISK